jgi:hypothetical protein
MYRRTRTHRVISAIAGAAIAVGTFVGVLSSGSGAQAALVNFDTTTTTPPAPGKPCGDDLGLSVKFVPNKLDQVDTKNAVGGDPFTLTYTELSAPDPNQLVFGGVTSSVYGTDLVVRRVFLDTGTTSSYVFNDPLVGNTLNPGGAGNLTQVLACVALKLDLTKTVAPGITGSHTYSFAIACSKGNDAVAFTRTITIDGAGTQTIEAPVPPGYDCTITETAIDGNPLPLTDWLVENNPAVIQNVGSTSAVTIVNKPALGALRFTKTVTGALAGETYSFDFSANCGGAGTFTFTLPEADATPLVWDKADLPVGTVCTISETAATPAGAWTATPNPAVATAVAAGQTTAVAMTNTRTTAKLTLVKNVSGGSASVSSWTLSATGPGSPATVVTGVSGTAAVTGVTVPTGSYALAETGSVAAYSNGSVWDCGAQGNGLTSVNLATGDDVTCTITNTRDTAKLTLVKNVSGGSADKASWTLTATGDAGTGATVISGAGGATNAAAPTGTYTLAETGSVAGYTNGSSWNCGVGQASVTSVTLTKGADVTCAITNTRDTATLTLVKSVSGGTAVATSWTLTATGDASTGATVISGASGDAAVTAQTVPTGPYALTESTVAGYTNGATWDCGTGRTAVTSVSLAKGENVTCTITNTRDTGTLTLHKIVLGGTTPATAWTLAATGPTAGVTGTDGAAAITNRTVDTGEYTLNETGTVAGYTNGTTWDCGTKGAAVTKVTVGKGENVTCTIANARDTGTLTLRKIVSGGTALPTAWTLTATGPTAGMTGTDGAAAITNRAVDTGEYTLNETGTVAGYTNGTTWDCGTKGAAVTKVTVGPAESVICTITNTRDTASLTLVKNVSGGSADPTSWTVAATGEAGTGPTVITGAGGATNAAAPTGSYALSETGTVAGYTNGTTWNCGTGRTAVTSVTLAKGENVRCTITNTRDTGTLTLLKIVSGGNQSITSWTLTATGPTTGVTGTSGASAVTNAPVATGEYSLAETGTIFGYTNGTTWDCGTKGTALTKVTVGKGENIACSITNTRDTAKLTLVKSVAGGTAAANSWTLTATGPVAITGAGGASSATAPTGIYALTETGTVANYVNGTTWDCGPKGSAITSVALDKGDDVTCTIVNKLVAIDITKSIALAIAGVCPTTGYVDSLSPVLVGSQLCYQFVITNPGAANLTSVTLTDNRFNLQLVPTTCSVPSTPLGTTGLSLGALAVGGSITCTTGPIIAAFGTGAQNVNTGTAVGCANATCSPSPSDSDTATYAPGYLGFTPGFWKNHTAVNSNNAWQAKYIGACMPPLSAVNPWTTTVAAVFPGTTFMPTITLLDALGLQGGSGTAGANQILLRAATAAYLNACYSATLIPGGGAGAYPLTTSQVINQTLTALNSNQRGAKITLAATLDLYNNTATHQITW